MQTPKSMKNKTGSEKHPLGYIWNSMVIRCYRDSHKQYHNYGGRGISVHSSWFDFLKFVEDVESEIGPRPSRKYTLDRIDNDGNYEPGNLQWLTRRDNVRRAHASR